jgi:kinesin family protein 2/24
VRSSDELEAHIIKALSHRRTTATHRNETSSRSHAMLKITIKNTFLPYADEGQLILVEWVLFYLHPRQPVNFHTQFGG